MITDLAHQLGKRCVAEWVEKPETVAALMALSVDYAQGFVMGRPMKPEAFLNARSAGDLIKNEKVKHLLGRESLALESDESEERVLRPALS